MLLFPDALGQRHDALQAALDEVRIRDIWRGTHNEVMVGLSTVFLTRTVG